MPHLNPEIGVAVYLWRTDAWGGEGQDRDGKGVREGRLGAITSGVTRSPAGIPETLGWTRTAIATLTKARPLALKRVTKVTDEMSVATIQTAPLYRSQAYWPLHCAGSLRKQLTSTRKTGK